jgi:hypothetical protein
MIELLIMAFVGYNALNSNTNNVTEWVKVTSSSFFEATVTPVVPQSDAKYLTTGAKPISWESHQSRPEGRTLALKPLKKDINGDAAVAVAALQKISKKQPTKEQEVLGHFSDVQDLGLLNDNEAKVNISTDQILSYFGKNVATQGNKDIKEKTDKPADKPIEASSDAEKQKTEENYQNKNDKEIGVIVPVEVRSNAAGSNLQTGPKSNASFESE